MINRVVGFLPGYATDKTRQFDIAAIPGDRITDLIYGFAGFTQQGQSWVVDYPEPNDAHPQHENSNVGKLIALKKKWPALNVCVSIGGWMHSHQGDPSFKTTPVFSAVAATPQARQAFVSSCIALFIKPAYPGLGPLFGGIDIDWEFPSPADRHNLTLLFEEFRSQLDSEGRAQARQITLSASSGVGANGLELDLLASTLDWINLMAYDAHMPNKNDPKDQFTDFGAPIYPAPAEPTSNKTWNIDAVVKSFTAAGFPAAKLALGISAYARTYAGVTDSNHGVYQPYTGPGPGSLGKLGVLEYKDLMANYLPAYQSHWDNVTKSAYLYSPMDHVWMSFDSVESVVAKTLYADQKGVGGLMLWELSADALPSKVQAPQLKIPALLDAMPFGISALSDKVVIDAGSGTAPALGFQDGRPFLAHTRSKGGNLRIMFWPEDGVRFAGTYTSHETSDAAPALTSHQSGLMIAWKGSGNDSLSVAQVSLVRDSKGKISRIAGLTNKVILGETSDHAPALACSERRLFLAWKGSGNDNLSVMFSSDNGATFEGKYISPETSSAAPALASDGSQVSIAWKGSGNEDLSVAQVAFF